jgi:hypothetical protein
VAERGRRATGELWGSGAASALRGAASAYHRVVTRLRLVAWSAGSRVLRGARGPAAVVPRDAGMATAEYAIATIAAVGFAGLLVVVLRSGEVQELLLGIIRGALTV